MLPRKISKFRLSEMSFFWRFPGGIFPAHYQIQSNLIAFIRVIRSSL